MFHIQENTLQGGSMTLEKFTLKGKIINCRKAMDKIRANAAGLTGLVVL